MLQLKGLQKMIMAAIGIIVALLLLWMLIGYLPTRNIDMPAYTIIENRAEYQIRRYEAFIVAETGQSGNLSESTSKGFNELFKYISGENIARSKITMTAPVLRFPEGEGEKIPMTAPVLKQGEEGAGTIAFVMPPGSTLEDLPQPKSPSVRLRVVPPHKVAVITFSGYATRDAIKEKTAILVRALKRDGIPAASDPLLALYNPPWTPPFMRMNEMMIEVD